MKSTLWIIGLVILAGTPAFAQNESFPLDGSPAWFEIVGDGTTTGTACVVRAVMNREPLGQLEPGYRFMAFGSNSKWVTLAYNGVTSYVPAAAASPVFVVQRPASETSNEMRMPGMTLEQQQKKNKERMEAAKSGAKPLAEDFTNNPTPKPTPNAMMTGSGRGGSRGGSSGRGGAGAM